MRMRRNTYTFKAEEIKHVPSLSLALTRLKQNTYMKEDLCNFEVRQFSSKKVLDFIYLLLVLTEENWASRFTYFANKT